MPGMGELLIILAIVLVLFGASKLPAVGDALGRTLKNFKRSVSGADELEVGPERRGELAGSPASDREA